MADLLLTKIDIDSFGKDMFNLMTELFPICRSITGDGVRETLNIIKRDIPLELHEVSTGTKVFDWAIPKEWNIKDAWIKDSTVKKIIDFQKSNLHVMNYSIPVNKKMSLSELKKHLFSLPEHPDRIPYLTSYYSDNWGFCLKHDHLKNLKEDTYEVVIDSSLKNGSLTYGELLIPGKLKEEVLLSCYVCHPSLCNDNLSGIVLLTHLAKYLMNIKNLKYSYRFLFIPETIGAITWLAKNEKQVKNVKHGLVATCCGNNAPLTYKKSRQGIAIIDKAVQKVLMDSIEPFSVVDFFPSGSDERQFCSPGFDLPVGSLMRTMYGEFDEYHTSADNLEFMDKTTLGKTFLRYLETIFILEHDAIYINTNPKCEPQLGRRGLYRLMGSQKTYDFDELAMLWVLNMSDGNNSLLDISIRSKIPFKKILNAANLLLSKELLRCKN